MKKFLLIFTFFYWMVLQKSNAQNRYVDTIASFRNAYKEDFVKEPRSPLKAKDTSFLRFYPAQKDYCVFAKLQMVPNAETFEMLTHNGKKQSYRLYAIAHFVLLGKKCQLHIYQNMRLVAQPEHQNHLFLPFNDLTNYETTYGGGRYLDLSTIDIRDGQLKIDFNKCYNPYCAFKEGYSCPIPPVENRLKLRIEAGEKLFAGKVAE